MAVNFQRAELICKQKKNDPRSEPFQLKIYGNLNLKACRIGCRSFCFLFSLLNNCCK
jgi:hypothetical protein